MKSKRKRQTAGARWVLQPLMDVDLHSIVMYPVPEVGRTRQEDAHDKPATLKFARTGFVCTGAVYRRSLQGQQ